MIREMEKSDWARVSEIYIQGLEKGIATFETICPKYEDWDKKYEKKLLKVTRRGVVKFFNSIVEHRKKEMEIVKNEEKEAQKKSNSFLMIHNLDYLNPNMNVKSII